MAIKPTNQSSKAAIFAYDAFISYSRKDTAFAMALEKALEDYRPPRDLDVKKEPLDIFRDENDLTGTEYFQSIDGHLKNSRKLLVLCSPNSRKSDFVNDEIKRFVKANDAKNVVPVIIAGVPDNEATTGQEDEKAFPPALFESMTVPLAKDYRDFDPTKDKINKSPFETSWYGILAEIYDKSRREIEERDRKKLARQRRIRTGIVAAVMVALSSLTVFALIQRDKFRQQRDETRRQLALNYWENSRTARDQHHTLQAPLALHLAAAAIRLSTDEALISDILLDIDRSAWLDIYGREYVLKPLAPKIFQHDAAIKGAKLSRDGKRILTWSDDSTARLWQAETGSQIGQSMKHDHAVSGAAFDQAEKNILTWSFDANATARLWQAETGRHIDMKHDYGYVDAVFDQAGKRILTWGGDNTARVWQAESGEQIGQNIKHDSGLVGVEGAVFDQAGERILTWSDDSTARLWQAETGTQIGPSMKHSNFEVFGAVFDQAGKRILTWDGDRTARVWQAGTGVQIGQTMKHEDSVWGALFDQAGKRVLTWGGGRTATLWQVETGRQFDMKHDCCSVDGAVFDQAGKRILTWGGDNTARLWQAETGAQIGHSMKHDSVVGGARFDQTEKRILTWSFGDSTARLWQAETGKQLGPSMKHGAGVLGAMFDQAGKRILTWSKDGTARLYDIEVDLDFPAKEYAIEVQVLTHSSFDESAKDIESLVGDDWHQVYNEYMQLARQHYRVCRYPRANRYRQLYPEEAATIRTLDE